MSLEALQKGKLSRDIAWTIGSFVVLAASGVTINVIIASLRDAASLGAFNLAYAVYIVASQLAVGGLHYSVLRASALHTDNPKECGRSIVTAAVLSLCSGGVMGLLVYMVSPLLGRAFSSEVVGAVVAYLSWGLVLFPLNKVLLAFLNGLRHMKGFALLQASRYLVIAGWVAGVCAMDVPFELTGLSFLVAELTTAILAVLYILIRKLIAVYGFDLNWVRRHTVFGLKSFAVGVFVEMNSRVDVLILGLFVSDRSVGIYSFAAMLVEGLYQVLAMVRLNFNPILVAVIRDGNWEKGRKLLRSAKRYCYSCMSALSVLVAGSLVIFALYVLPGKGLQGGLPCLIILLICLNLVSAFIPFDNILMLGGYPSYQTLQHLIIMLSNLLLNFLFIPYWGIEGAAAATGMSLIVGVLALFVLVDRLIGWNLLTNMTKTRSFVTSVET